MKKTNIIQAMTKQHRIPKKQKIWAGIITIAVIAIVIAVSSFINAPRDIGKDLVYVDKVNTSCEWWEVPLYLGFCRLPSYDYYFATDMNEAALKKYFRKATLVDVRTGYSASEPIKPENTHFIFEYQGQDFVIDMPASKEQITKDLKLKSTSKARVISIPDFDYKLAKEAL